MQGDPYRHAHGHSQQPGNEWNDSRGMRAPNPGSVGGAWNPGATGPGGGSGIGMLVLLALAALIAVPAAAMAILSAPVLKAIGPRLGHYVSFGWWRTFKVSTVGGMWYLGLTCVLYMGVETYLTYGLDGMPASLEGLAPWQQWLASVGWSAAQLIEWVARFWQLGEEYEQYGRLYPPVVPMAFLVTGVAALHAPGLAAYSRVLQRAGYLGDGVRGLLAGTAVALLLVVVTFPVTMWLGRWVTIGIRQWAVG